MKIIGIVCEYNPFHLGHRKQLAAIRTLYGGDCAIVCLMSGNYGQRGQPAIFDKSCRAEAAISSGADLVLELPVTYALSSAEGFAAGGVLILSGFCDGLCFGTESGDQDRLISTAQALLSPTFPDALRQQLDKGLSFPAARQAALGEMGELLRNPNDILAVEYCKAILSQESAMEPIPIFRQGSYHDDAPDPENPSATFLRKRISESGPWHRFVPESAVSALENADIHLLSAGEQAILARLRTMTEEEFESIPYGSEGLWRKFMHACRSQASLEEIISATKSKRYTRTRLDRMVMCAFLGITQAQLDTPAPYTRVLAFNDAGRAVLKRARLSGSFPHVGEAQEDPYWLLEQRCSDLYGLFRAGSPAPAGLESKRRVFVQK